MHDGHIKCLCDPSKCKNKTEKESDDEKYKHYSEKSFVPVDTTFDETQFGPKPNLFQSSDSPQIIFSKLLGKEISNHIIEQSDLCKHYNNDQSSNAKELKSYYVKLRKWNVRNRMKKSNGNVSNSIASKSRASKKGKIELGSVSAESTKKKRYSNPTLVLIKDKGQENIQSIDLQREENNDIIAESDTRPIKPDIMSFNKWRQGKTSNNNGPFAANKLETFIRVIYAMEMKRITSGYYGYWEKKMYHSSVMSKLM